MRFLIALLAVQAASNAQSAGEPIIIGETVTIQSSVLKEPRSLRIAKPAGYEKGSDRYPVLYLLDAESSFHFATGIVQFLGAEDRIPPLLVVAIDSGTFARRTRDLSPPSQSETDNRFLPGNGGADAFLSFIETELIPYVDRTWRTRPYRLIAGHSFGGLFAIHTLLTRPKLFNAWIAIDPSLAWNNQATVARAEAFFSATKQLESDFYLTASNGGGKVPAGARRLAAILDEKAPAAFRWKFEWMEDETHGSIPLRSMHNALDTIFDGWHLTNPLDLYDKGGLEAVHRHFQAGGRRCGVDRATPPFTVSLIVAALMRTGRLEEAAAVLMHDPKAYPPPWNQLDALARAYADRGDSRQAVRYYSLSLEENPKNDWARRKVAEMQSQKP